SVAVVLAAGGWFTVTRLVTAVVGGTVLMVALGALDLSRPPEQRGSLGDVLAAAADGTAGLAIRRATTANVIAAATSPLTIALVVGLGFGLAVLMQPWGGLKRLYGLYPALRATLAGIALATLLGGLAGGAGLVAAGAAAAIVVPLVTLTAVRSLAHADDRTAAPLPPGTAGPGPANASPGTAGPGPGDDTTPATGRGPAGVLL
ncbi:MAG TPA: hypothetical protein VF163_23110, partial [Micromonosporaceae bacterium]